VFTFGVEERFPYQNAKMTAPMMAITPRATPMPIPALAPDESPDFEPLDVNCVDEPAFVADAPDLVVDVANPVPEVDVNEFNQLDKSNEDVVAEELWIPDAAVVVPLPAPAVEADT